MKRTVIGWLAIALVVASGVIAAGQCGVEVEDNNSFALADRVAILPGSGCIDGSIGVVGDIDFYYFDLSAPRDVFIETITNEDTEIALLDSDGNSIAQNDDIALNVFSSGIEAFLFFTFYGLDAVTEKKVDHLHVNMAGNPSSPMPTKAG